MKNSFQEAGALSERFFVHVYRHKNGNAIQRRPFVEDARPRRMKTEVPKKKKRLRHLFNEKKMKDLIILQLMSLIAFLIFFSRKENYYVRILYIPCFSNINARNCY